MTMPFAVLPELTEKVRLEVFLPEIRMLAPGCPDEIIASYVRQAAIELADKTLCLKREATLALQGGVREYLLEPDDCVRVVSIDWVCDARGTRHFPKPHQPCVVPCAAGACWPTCQGAEFNPFEGYQWVTFKQPNSFILSFEPKVDMGVGMLVRMSVAPKRDACDIDELLYEKYAQDIHAGAAAFLLMMQNQPWYQPQMASILQKRWLTAQSKIAGDALVQESRGPFQMKAQRIV